MNPVAPRFWWTKRAGLAAVLLEPVAAVYGRVAATRMAKPASYRSALPTICVGNLVVGGAGKTPTALTIGRLVKAGDRKAGFLTRGYGAKTEQPVLVEPGKHSARDVGDEPLLLAEEAPTVVGGDRPAGARLLESLGVEVIVMDDGFQNPSLAKDLSFLVVDAGAGVGNGRVLPAGPLRGPVDPQIQRASAIVVVGNGDRAERVVRAAARAGKPTLCAHLRPSRRWDETRPLLAYAGIGRPGKFFASLRDIGADLREEVSFPDHHRYSEADALRLLDRAAAEGFVLATTSKDWMRLSGEPGALATLREQSRVLAVDLVFDSPDQVARMIEDAIGRFEGQTRVAQER